VVALFAMAAGRYSYVTRNKVAAPMWKSEGVNIELDSAGCARVSFDFAKPGVKLLFFGKG
jgi:hypothetical protein